MTLAQHQSLTDQHFTPPPVVRCARNVLGRIDLDPASCYEANEHLVQAERYFTEAEDGLSRRWWGNVFLNPPGGWIDGESSQRVWLESLLARWREGEVQRAVFVGFNLEIIRMVPEFLTYAFCIPSKRLRYWSWDPEREEIRQGQWSEKKQRWTDSPSHATAILYLPGEARENVKFCRTFLEIGPTFYGATRWQGGDHAVG